MDETIVTLVVRQGAGRRALEQLTAGAYIDAMRGMSAVLHAGVRLAVPTEHQHAALFSGVWCQAYQAGFEFALRMAAPAGAAADDLVAAVSSASAHPAEAPRP